MDAYKFGTKYESIEVMNCQILSQQYETFNRKQIREISSFDISRETYYTSCSIINSRDVTKYPEESRKLLNEILAIWSHTYFFEL